MKLTSKFVLKNLLNHDGSQTLTFRITLNREIIPIYTDIRIHSKFWDPVKQRVKDGHILHETHNTDLDTLIRNFTKFISDSKYLNTEVDKYSIRNHFNNKKEAAPSKDFLFFCQEDINKYGKTNLKKSSLYIHENCLACLKEFRSVVTFDDINVSFLMDYEKHLKGLKNDVNTIHKKIKFIRTYINKAIKLGIYDKYVFKNYTLKTKASKPNYLSESDFTKLVDFYFETKIPLYKKHLQYFLFACCTGLRYSDLKSLKWEAIKDNNIYIRMQKTEEVITIPLNPKIKSFLPTEKTDSFIFDLPTNQVGNRILKDIAIAAKVQKILTFHVARHTFATLSLNYGIPLHCVQKLLGHRKSETTQIYAKLVDKTLQNEMQKWN